MSANPIRLLRSFATVGGWTMASRVLGFVRDILIAAFLGSGPIAEAFFVAFRLPNMFRRFFAEGAFNMAFIPMFAKRLEGDGPDAARKFGTEALSVLFAALLVLTVLAQIAMPWFVYALASGFEGDDRFETAVLFSRIVFPYILFISLAALFSGVLNAFGKFAAAAAAPVLLNVVFIAAILAAHWMQCNVGLALVWAAAFAGVAQLALVWIAASRIGMGLTLKRPRLTPDVRRLIRIGIPAALAGGVMQINLLVGTQVASYFDRAISWLSYADRVYQLPLGVVGIAIGVVLLPELSRRFRAGDSVGTAEAMNRATEFTMILTIPAAVALVAIPGLVVSTLFERGSFSAADTNATAQALAIYAIGLPSFVLQKVLQPAYFAREDTKTPLRFALISMVVNVVLAIGLAPVFGFLAAAIGTTVAGWAMVMLLWRGVHRLDPTLTIDARLRYRAPRILISAIIMGASGWGLATWLPSVIPSTTVTFLIVFVVSVLIYFTLAAVLGAFRPSDIKQAMRRTAS